MHIAPSRRSEVIEQENRHVKEPETPDVASRFERRQDARFMRIPARTELLRRLERIVLDSEEPSLRKSRMHVARQLDYATWDKLHRAVFGSTDAGLRRLHESIEQRLSCVERWASSRLHPHASATADTASR